MVYAALIISLIVLAFENFLHFKERKDLYNRIMANDLRDYTAANTKKTPKKGRSFIRDAMEKLRKQNVID